MLLVSLLLASMAHAAPAAATTPQDCLKVADSLDRKYCLDKHLQSVKKTFDAEKKTWSKGLTADAKEDRSEALANEMASKKEYISLLQSEIALAEQQLTALTSVKTTAPATPKKKKKKEKNKLPFGIKL